jgi:hypothetical protein
LVARLVWDQKAESSSLSSPTTLDILLDSMYDVTFHPIAEHELKGVVRSVVFGEFEFRERMISKIPRAEDREHVAKIYTHLDKTWSRISTDATTEFFSWSCAAIAGYLHPFWWGKNTALKHLPDFDGVYKTYIRNVFSVDPEAGALVPESMKNITLNDSYGGGGYIPAENIPACITALSLQITKGTVDAYDVHGFIFALLYARDTGCGLLEASGVHDTWQGSSTYQENLRTLLVRIAFPYVSISMPDVSDWKKQAEVFADKDPEAYALFVRNCLLKHSAR